MPTFSTKTVSRGSMFFAFPPPPSSGRAAASPRHQLAQAALYLQLSWLACELVVGIALLVLYPCVLGERLGSATAPPLVLNACCSPFDAHRLPKPRPRPPPAARRPQWRPTRHCPKLSHSLCRSPTPPSLTPVQTRW